MRRLFFVLLTVVSLSAFAQSDTTVAQKPILKFGYLSYEKALHSMPDYAIVQQRMTDLRAQFEAEAKRVESEFNRKYEEFLEGMKDFPKTILQKRQTELQKLLEENVAFREKGRQELSATEKDLMAPLQKKLNEALADVGRERGYALIVNTDANACPFIDPVMGEDINEEIANRLNSQE